MLEREIVDQIESGWSFVSNIFARPKPNNNIRLIIDLYPLNDSLQKVHFKIDNLQSAVDFLSIHRLERCLLYLASGPFSHTLFVFPMGFEDLQIQCHAVGPHVGAQVF